MFWQVWFFLKPCFLATFSLHPHQTFPLCVLILAVSSSYTDIGHIGLGLYTYDLIFKVISHYLLKGSLTLNIVILEVWPST